MHIYKTFIDGFLQTFVKNNLQILQTFVKKFSHKYCHIFSYISAKIFEIVYYKKLGYEKIKKKFILKKFFVNSNLGAYLSGAPCTSHPNDIPPYNRLEPKLHVSTNALAYYSRVDTT